MSLFLSVVIASVGLSQGMLSRRLASDNVKDSPLLVGRRFWSVADSSICYLIGGVKTAPILGYSDWPGRCHVTEFSFLIGLSHNSISRTMVKNIYLFLMGLLIVCCPMGLLPVYYLSHGVWLVYWLMS